MSAEECPVPPYRLTAWEGGFVETTMVIDYDHVNVSVPSEAGVEELAKAVAWLVRRELARSNG